jgi:hypothetical protein
MPLLLANDRAPKTSLLVVARRFGYIALLLALLIGPVVARWPAGDSPDDLHVLFIGNSFTYYHDMPAMVAELAKAAGQPALRFEQVTPGGYTLEKHWQEHNALAQIEARHWDYVVLQDQSQAPLLKRKSLNEYARKFDAEIATQGSKTILYQTWALRSKPTDQAAISTAYEQLAKDLKATLAPVGNAWRTALAADKKLVLHDQDQKHPNAAGSYLAACVFYATIYGQSPEGLPAKFAGLTNDQARPLQTIAWKAVQATAPTGTPAITTGHAQ